MTAKKTVTVIIVMICFQTLKDFGRERWDPLFKKITEPRPYLINCLHTDPQIHIIIIIVIMQKLNMKRTPLSLYAHCR